jgi:hypothetical protein
MYNSDQPTVIENISRIIVIGDVHGDIKRLLECMINAKVFSRDLEWIAEPKNTIVVQMGDQIDSLNRSLVPEWEELPDYEVLLLMEKLDNIAKLEGGRVLSLLGNHEIMNTMGMFSYVSQKSLKYLPENERKIQFNLGNRFAKLLSHRNIVLKINNLLFCHAGLLPHHLLLCDNNLHKINEVSRRILRGEKVSLEEYELFDKLAVDPDSILWNRHYITDNDMIVDMIKTVLNDTKTDHIFIGHNTVENIKGLHENTVILTDAGLSRAYGLDITQYIDICDGAINIKKFKM